MHQCSSLRIRLMVARAALASCLVTSVVSAQTATESALKAAYLLKFTKFTEWPAAALGPGEPLTLCVLNDDAVAGTLSLLAKDQSVDGHALTVLSLKDTASLKDWSALTACRLLFAPGIAAGRSTMLLDSLAGKPILTVGNLDKFAKLGGVVGFFVEDGSLRFAINLAAAQRAGLVLSSKLLNLAKIVKDDRRDGPQR